MFGELQVQPTVTHVALHGELDLMTVDKLRALLREACAGVPQEVIVDLSDVPFVDVLSLSAVLATADALRERGASLTVIGASTAIRRICALLNAEDVLAPELPLPLVAVH